MWSHASVIHSFLSLSGIYSRYIPEFVYLFIGWLMVELFLAWVYHEL